MLANEILKFAYLYLKFKAKTKNFAQIY